MFLESFVAFYLVFFLSHFVIIYLAVLVLEVFNLLCFENFSPSLFVSSSSLLYMRSQFPGNYLNSSHLYSRCLNISWLKLDMLSYINNGKKSSRTEVLEYQCIPMESTLFLKPHSTSNIFFGFLLGIYNLMYLWIHTALKYFGPTLSNSIQRTENKYSRDENKGNRVLLSPE